MATPTRSLLSMLATAAAGVAIGAAVAAAAARRLRRVELAGRVVVITGGGRGLGFAIAQAFAARGCRLAICGRDGAEIAAAEAALRAQGVEVFGAACDAADPVQVDAFVDRVLERFGAIDVLVNNAGQCYVGPVTAFGDDDMAHALRNIFWVQYYPTMAVLAHMRARRFGRIVHISSIGGKLPLPHQAPYAAGKFALAGWSASIAAELDREGIRVSTLTPPPLRNGAALYANFTGDVEAEFRWFTAALSTPLTSSTAAAVARAVVDAAEHGDGERAVSALSWIPARGYGVAPNAAGALLRLVDRVVMPQPPADGAPTRMRYGAEVAAATEDAVVRVLATNTVAQAAAHRPLALSRRAASAPRS